MPPAMRYRIGSTLIAALLTGLVWCDRVQATGLFSGIDTEKPVPEFTRSGDRITARFIPRAKSSSVTVEFAVVTGGTLDAVKGVDFVAVDRPEVDIKNFKSAAFELDIGGLAPGAEATVAIRSDFFSLSTAFYVFNPDRAPAWIPDAQTANRPLTDRVRELLISVRDGGERDADGAVDGRIRLVGGPRDSFWGYALGTLFIRFFGIFFVLVVLMVGMLASGRLFTLLDRLRRTRPSPGPEAATPSGAAPVASIASESTQDTSGEVAALIGAALYLRDRADSGVPSTPAAPQSGQSWSLAGRQRLMQDRLTVFHEAGRRAARRGR